MNPVKKTIAVLTLCLAAAAAGAPASPRERVSIDDGWRFTRGDPNGDSTGLIYDVRPLAADEEDARPATAVNIPATNVAVLKPWILPTANPFIKKPADRHAPPKTGAATNVAYTRADFDDRAWQPVDLPHDWAIAGPFHVGGGPGVGGGMGRLPSPGIGWYRRKLDIPPSDAGKSIFLDVDGAMSYAMVWLNGRLIGGWPYGYASWRVDLTPDIVPGGKNQLAIRLDNPPEASRWYPGGGLYRNVWLIKTAPVHIAHWGTDLTTPDVSREQATVKLAVTVDNDATQPANVTVATEIFALNAKDQPDGSAVAKIAPVNLSIAPQKSVMTRGGTTVLHPRLWGPPPAQKPNRYVAMTTVSSGGKILDRYQTPFGIREIRFDADHGIFVNGERVPIQGVNLHHDLGPLGAAFNVRAAERQLEQLREMGANAIRTSHNPPAPELLELADKMGFLVLDEIFDCWYRPKTPLDFHLIFPEWHEPDLRAFLRRDRNHPSVFLWSVGNEVGEQYTGAAGAEVARELCDIVHVEDPTRPVTAALNFSKPDMPLPGVLDVIGLNYQGEGIRNAPTYARLKGIATPPQYDAFHQAFPGKVILSTEAAAALSSRGEYRFPVCAGSSAPVSDDSGGDATARQVSAYGLYSADFGSSPDKVFAAQDEHPFVAGEFVWSGWDYLGEPTPYYGARSSYFGVIDLAGFKKDEFYLYQAHWRPDDPMAHILPHWTWPERVGQVTPVHVFTSGDAAELFLNGRSLGRKTRGPHEYRLRWDHVVYQPGTLKVVAYRHGKRWATDEVKTAGAPAKLELAADRKAIRADGRDLAFVTVKVVDADGVTAPRADAHLYFRLAGPGEMVATANGDPNNFQPFSAHDRNAFNGRCLVIVRAKAGEPGAIKLTATAPGLRPGETTIQIMQ